MKKLKIVVDPDPISPREWDNMGRIAYKHPRYKLGEEEISDPIEWLEGMLFIENKGEYSGERLRELEQRFYREYIALPVYLYDHSGITMSTTPFSCNWDSGKVGYVYVSKKEARLHMGVNKITKKVRERIETNLRYEVEAFDQYLTGEVFCFVVEDEEGNMIDSCCGFYGQDWGDNGMKDYLSEELWPKLEGIEVEY